MHLGQGTTICGFLPRHRALLPSTAILVERGSKIPREQTERGIWGGCLAATLPTQRLQTKFPFRTAIPPHYKKNQKRREGSILPPDSNIQTSLKSLADASPTSFHPRSVQDCKPGSLWMPPSMAKGAPKRPNSLGKSPLLLLSDSLSLCNRLSLLDLPPGGLARKNQF